MQRQLNDAMLRNKYLEDNNHNINEEVKFVFDNYFKFRKIK